MQIDWIQVCTMLLTFAGTLLGGFAWIVGKLDKIKDELSEFRKEFVSKESCRNMHGESCRRLEVLEKRFDMLDRDH